MKNGSLLINTSDLLPRREQALDPRPVAEWLRDRKVAVTGAGGSIGSELSRQLGAYPVKMLTLIENNEHALYQIGRELPHAREKFGCVRDLSRMNELLNDQDVVFHAAAMKHVPLCEQNKAEANETNIRGTANIFKATGASCRVVLVSTDKAVNPTSHMGKTKRHAEILARSSGRAAVVRFGNVIGSSGSVVPLFKEQIAAGGPVTITDRRMTRYFMSIAEASELVLQAGAQGVGTYVLDMGEPVRIATLVEEMIRLSGRRDVRVVETGIRPGEKLFEELSDGELVETGVPGLRRVVE